MAMFSKRADEYVPSEKEQNGVLNNYLNKSFFGPPAGAENIKNIFNTRLPQELKLQDYIGKTTPAHVLAGVYGKNLPGEVNKANQYNSKYKLPSITPDILNNTNVYKSQSDFTTPSAPVTGINNSAEGAYVFPKEMKNPWELGIINGLQPLKPGVNVNKPESPVFDNFSEVRKRPVMPMQDTLEHEIAGHRVYEPNNVTRLPKTISWPGGYQPYQQQRGEALNGLAAIQRDQFQNTGQRYNDPAVFRQDVNNVLNSPDIEKAMDNQGWGRTDAKRLIRSLVPMDPKKRQQWINSASKAVPGMVQNNTSSPQVKTGSYYHDRKDIQPAIEALQDYFKSPAYKNPDISNVPDFPEPSEPSIEEIADASGEDSFMLNPLLGVAALAIPTYLLNHHNKKDNEEIPSESERLKSAYTASFMKRAAEYGYSESEISEAVKTAGALEKIKAYMKKHEDEPSESVLKGFMKKQKEGLPVLLKMRRLDRMREIGRKMDEK